MFVVNVSVKLGYTWICICNRRGVSRSHSTFISGLSNREVEGKKVAWLPNWRPQLMFFSWQSKPASFHGKSDHLQAFLLQRQQVFFFAKLWYFSNPNHVVSVPTPDQIISTVLWQKRNRRLDLNILHVKGAKYKKMFILNLLVLPNHT